MGCVNERASVIEPVQDRGILGLIEVELNSFKGIHIKNIVAIVEWGFLVIERWESHPLEVPAVPLLPTHSQPHAAPLRVIHRFDDTGKLAHESDSPVNVIKDWNLAYLFPFLLVALLLHLNPLLRLDSERLGGIRELEGSPGTTDGIPEEAGAFLEVVQARRWWEERLVCR
jgi:hypothetical protein